MFPPIARRMMLALSLSCAAGCAGELENPEAFLVDTSDELGNEGNGAKQDGGTPERPSPNDTGNTGSNNTGDATGSSTSGAAGSTGAGGGDTSSTGGVADAGATGSSNGASTGADACGDVYATLIEPRCASSGCHGANAAGGLDLTDNNLAGKLVDVPGSASCGELPFVVSGDPTSGLLYQKVAGDPPCGTPMPLGGQALNATELDCLAGWLAALTETP